jgi:ABC-type branched-subunit amino acid transport system ATPase component
VTVTAPQPARVTGERRPAHLAVDDLRVQFGGVQALDSVTFSAEPGAIVGLIGANGSGKTTTLDVISGLVAPNSGTVRVDGIDLEEYLPEERLSVGMVRSFQDCRLYPELSVLDVLLLCEDAKHEVAVLSSTLRLPWARRSERRKLDAVNQVIAAFGLERFRHHRTAELSTGTRRVVDLASIVLAQPRLLLLDEPTAGIAQREAEAFIPLLRRLHQVVDTTIVLVEHDVPLVFELCTQVVVMELGKVVAAGPPDAIRADPKALAAYLGASEEAIQASGPVGGTRAAGAAADGGQGDGGQGDDVQPGISEGE